jgi:hypothetical protein
VFTDFRASLDDGQSYDFAGVNIGAAADDRVLIIATHSASDIKVTYSALRIGGVDAVKLVSVGEDVKPTAPTALFVAAIPSGTTADIHFDLTFPEIGTLGYVVRGAVAVFAAYGLSSTDAHATATRISVVPASMILNVPDGGIFVAALGMAGDASSTASWGTLTPAYSHVLVETPGTPTLLSGVSAGPLTPAGNQEISISTVGTGYNFRAVAASFH